MGDARPYLGSAVSASYVVDFDLYRGIHMVVRFTTQGPEVTDYALALIAQRGGRVETIRTYDSAHGHNEMHRYTSSGGKQTGKPFHSGTLGEGLRLAIEEIKVGHHKMIEGWERR